MSWRFCVAFCTSFHVLNRVLRHGASCEYWRVYRLGVIVAATVANTPVYRALNDV